MIACLELGDGFWRSSQAVQGLSAEHVRCGGVGITMQNLLEFIERARVFLRREATLSQKRVQFDVRGIGLGRNLKVLTRLGKAFCAVIAQTKQSSRLHVVRIGGRGCVQRGDRLIEVSLLEFGQAQIELDSRELGI